MESSVKRKSDALIALSPVAEAAGAASCGWCWWNGAAVYPNW